LDADGTVKILDMGLARLEGGPELSTSEADLTGTGTIMGTVDYMAPEQAINTKIADARADIYSLGCTFFFLLTARVPFDGKTMVEKVLAHRQHSIPNLTQVRADVPPDVAAVFEKMMAKALEDRYQTMTDAIADLERAQSRIATGGSLPPAVQQPMHQPAAQSTPQPAWPNLPVDNSSELSIALSN